MDKKFNIGIVIGLVVIGLALSFQFYNLGLDNKIKVDKITDDKITVDKILAEYFANHTVKTNFSSDFESYLTENEVAQFQQGVHYTLKDGLKLEKDKQHSEFYEKFKPKEKTIVIFPIFTSAAYREPGFYTFFNNNCDETCLTVNYENPEVKYPSSAMTTQVLHALGYDFITDIDVDRNPEILQNYDKIILLHNEYVTRNEFDAISTHPNIIFLYPNALFAEVEVDYADKTIKLIRGHGYPNYPNGPMNGFDYEIEERFHEYEFDTTCLDWKFIEIENGYHLNCYPDNMIHNNLEILLAMNDL